MSLIFFFFVSKSQDVRDFPALPYSGAFLALWLDWVIFSQHLSPQSYILVLLITTASYLLQSHLFSVSAGWQFLKCTVTAIKQKEKSFSTSH